MLIHGHVFYCHPVCIQYKYVIVYWMCELCVCMCMRVCVWHLCTHLFQCLTPDECVCLFEVLLSMTTHISQQEKATVQKWLLKRLSWAAGTRELKLFRAYTFTMTQNVILNLPENVHFSSKLGLRETLIVCENWMRLNPPNFKSVHHQKSPQMLLKMLCFWETS